MCALVLGLVYPITSNCTSARTEKSISYIVSSVTLLQVSDFHNQRYQWAIGGVVWFCEQRSSNSVSRIGLLCVATVAVMFLVTRVQHFRSSMDPRQPPTPPATPRSFIRTRALVCCWFTSAISMFHRINLVNYTMSCQMLQPVQVTVRFLCWHNMQVVGSFSVVSSNVATLIKIQTCCILQWRRLSSRYIVSK